MVLVAGVALMVLMVLMVLMALDATRFVMDRASTARRPVEAISWPRWVRFDPDSSRRVIVFDEAGTVSIWELAGTDPSTSRWIPIERWASGAKWPCCGVREPIFLGRHPDGPRLTLVSGGTVRTWTLEGVPLGAFDLAEGRMRSTAVSRDGTVLAFGGPTLVRDATERAITLHDLPGGTIRQTIPVDDEHAAGALAFSPAGDVLAVASGAAVRCWDLPSGAPRGDWAYAGRYAGHGLAIDPTGRWIAARDGAGNERIELLSVVRPGTWHPWVGGAPIIGLTESISFHPVGRFMAVPHLGGLVGLYDLAAARAPIRSVRGPPATSVARSTDFSPDGRWLAVARTDGVRLYDVRTTRPVGSPLLARPPDAVVRGGARWIDRSALLAIRPATRPASRPESGTE